MLTDMQVVDIYLAKPTFKPGIQTQEPDINAAQGRKSQSTCLAIKYTVTSRTIRDIWARRSWAYATRHLWQLESEGGESMIFTSACKVGLLIMCVNV